MEHIDSGLFQIGKLPSHAVQVAGKVVDVQHHAGEIIGFVPLRIGLTFQITLFQGGGALLGEAVQVIAQLGEHGVISIQLHVQPAQLVQMPGQTFLKLLFLFFCHSAYPSVIYLTWITGLKVSQEPDGPLCVHSRGSPLAAKSPMK